jgi:hypothetical protein
LGQSRYFVALLFIFFCLALLVPTRARVASAPILLTRPDSTRAIAFESVTRVTEPFAPVNNGASWNADSGALFDFNSNALRPAGWTSADAAGLPIFPGLVRYDEVFEQQEIKHAIRFTAQITRRAYVAPARHWASTNTNVDRPPMGMRVRLKASVDISGYSPAIQVILRALKKYGMILADNGSNWFISGAPDPRWNDSELNTLKNIKGSQFEVIKMTNIVTP